MGMRFPLWSRVVSGLRHHLMKKNIRHNALKKGQVTVRAPLWASLVGAGVFVNLKMIQDITFGEGREIHTWHLDKRHGWLVCWQDLVDLRISVTYVETHSSRNLNWIITLWRCVSKCQKCGTVCMLLVIDDFTNEFSYIVVDKLPKERSVLSDSPRRCHSCLGSHLVGKIIWFAAYCIVLY